ncbi:MAG: hypothetical protein ACPGU7_11955 [Gammaproteobacteria bacterium]
MTRKFPYIALALGLTFLLILTRAAQVDEQGNLALPLLALLGMAELGFFVCGFGVWFAAKELRAGGFQPILVGVAVLCALLGLRLAWIGTTLWPGLIG